jgi:Tol biopolymer transport system component
MKAAVIWNWKSFGFRHWLPLITILLGACYETPVSPATATKINGVEDVIAYDALGGGKLGFHRMMEFFVIDADAGTTWGLSNVIDAALSPDGKFVTYQNFVDHGARFQIFVYNISSSQSRNLSASEWACSNPSWTPDSGFVIYEWFSSNETTELVRHSVKGDNRATITTYKRIDDVTSVISASPNGTLAFSFRAFKEQTAEIVSGIFTVNMDGSGLTQVISDLPREALSPVWSPNGETIAYLDCERDPGMGYKKISVTLIDRHGTNTSTIATFQPVANRDGAFGAAPSMVWSPDGTRLALNVFEADGAHIYVIKADGSGLTKVTSLAGTDDGKLSWSR